MYGMHKRLANNYKLGSNVQLITSLIRPHCSKVEGLMSKQAGIPNDLNQRVTFCLLYSH